jgi:hypothetical protein
MKTLFLLVIIIVANLTYCEAAEIPYYNTLQTDTCPRPTDSKMRELCGTIILNEKLNSEDEDYYSYTWEKELWLMSCADPMVDSPDSAKAKIQRMWNKYKTCFVCESNQNILKYATNKSKTEFINLLAWEYKLDINFIDPDDNRNVYDYFNEYYKQSIKLNGLEHIRTKVLKGYVETIVSLGGKSSK